MITTPGCKHNKIWNTCEECRPNLVDPNSLFEKLAAIEHERWAEVHYGEIKAFISNLIEQVIDELPTDDDLNDMDYPWQGINKLKQQLKSKYL